ncbi:hypothetical protein G8759_14745 [Spirosoma aureum]|uniref:Lipoprotein n=1 Tax=Spirosoma aureum TaxID=2692134 RepID=A0A6G9AMT0_9BACT|nr:hypothetical protein [Spirosoma aureum]QIP13781.1 hypothetical protein G8759_14745 [Spirosoma aureum]
MITQLARKFFSHSLTLSIAIAALLSGCSKPEAVDPPEATPAQYELKDVRYFFQTGDRVDTTTLQLKGQRVQNPGTILATQQVEEGFGGLVKTSRFIFDPTTQFPQELDLSQFEVSVPEHWYGNALFDRSLDTYSFSTIEQQKPYGFDPKGILTVKIPPKSKIDISRQISAYQLTCSFEGILENTTTGQRLSLRGKWKGLLQYANPTTIFRESAL